MPTIDHTFTLQASLEDVAAFHSDTNVLKHLMPPPVILQMHLFEPLAEGSIADFTLWIGPIPARWRAVHSQVNLPHGFIDTQQQGLLKSWVHRHTFTALGDNLTAVNDHIEYEHHNSPRGIISRLLFGRLVLRGLFFYRKLVTRRIVQSTRRAP